MEWIQARTELQDGDGFVDVVCRHTKQEGLGILHLQNMNTTLLMEWVNRIMSPQYDLAGG